MTFLALSPFEAALLAGITIGTIVALYFLKLRHRRIVVSSSLLWRRVLEAQTLYSRRERIRTIVSIVVASAIALLMALSVGRPQIGSLTGKTRRIVIVLDSSPSMSTRTTDGGTRWQRAVQRAHALIDGADPAAEFSVIDTSGNVAFPFTSRSEARALIDTIAPAAAAGRFPHVDSSSSTVYFVSDGVSIRDVPAFAESLSVFEPAQNIAITAFEVRPVPADPLEYEAYLEVHNYGSTTELELSLSGGGQDQMHRSVRLNANETLKEVFDLSGTSEGSIQARVHADNDALPTDDVAFAWVPVQRRTRVLLVAQGESHLKTLLQLDRHVDLQVADPRNYREQPGIDAYVFDRFAPSSPPSRPALVIGAPAAPWLKASQGVVSKPQITAWSESHPIMRFVSLHDISIQRATRIDPGTATVVAGSQQAPLIVVSDAPRWVMLTFDLSASDFSLQAGFPVFIENVLAWLNGESLAVRRQPGIVVVPLENAEIRTSDGRAMPSQRDFGNTVVRISEPGLYTAARGDTTVHVAVQLASPALSNVNASIFKDGTRSMPGQSRVHRELWFFMLIGAVVLLSLEWLTYHRRITV
jgi:hypothetical protein